MTSNVDLHSVQTGRNPEKFDEMQKSHINDLPDEIFFKIFEWLEVRKVYSHIVLVSKKWRKLSENELSYPPHFRKLKKLIKCSRSLVINDKNYWNEGILSFDVFWNNVVIGTRFRFSVYDVEKQNKLTIYKPGCFTSFFKDSLVCGNDELGPKSCLYVYSKQNYMRIEKPFLQTDHSREQTLYAKSNEYIAFTRRDADEIKIYKGKGSVITINDPKGSSGRKFQSLHFAGKYLIVICKPAKDNATGLPYPVSRDNNCIKIFEAETGKGDVIGHMVGQFDEIMADEQTLVGTLHDESGIELQVYNPRTFILRYKLTKKSGIFLLQDGKIFNIKRFSKDSFFSVYNVQNGKLEKKLEIDFKGLEIVEDDIPYLRSANENTCEKVVIEKSYFAMILYSRREIDIWDWEMGIKLRTFRTETFVRAIKFDLGLKTGKPYLAAVLGDERVQMWSLDIEKQQENLPAEPSWTPVKSLKDYVWSVCRPVARYVRGSCGKYF